jgi:hypothetical protein
MARSLQMIAAAILPMIAATTLVIIVTTAGMTMTEMRTKTAIETTCAADPGPFAIKRTAL